MTDTTPPAYPAPTAPVALPPAGWYPDPGGGPGQRWWDGRHWHGSSNAAGGSGATGGRTDGFAIAAIVLAALGVVVLAVIFAVIALSRIKKGKRQAGRGMAIAALWISAAYVLVVGAFVALVLTGVLDEKNVDKYHGEKREIARVVDRFEDEADSGGEGVCALMTQEFQDTVAATESTCPNGFDDVDGIQVNLDATSITLTGAGHATAVVDEADHTLRMYFVREPDGWKLDDITTEP